MPESQFQNKPASMNPPSVVGSTPGQDLSLGEVTSKEEFEIRKLELEIVNLRRWWIQPGFIQAVFGTLIGCGTLLTGYLNGWFDVQRARLEVETARLLDKRSELQIQLSKAANTGARLTQELEKTKTALSQEAQAHDKAEKARQEQQRRTQTFSAALRDLTKQLSNADVSLKQSVDNLNRQWSAIATNRDIESAKYKASNDRLTEENAQLQAQLQKRPGTSSQNKETNGQEPKVLMDQDPNLAAEALFMANSTPEQRQQYKNATPDQKREMEVKAVLSHLEVVNQIMTNSIRSDKETKDAIKRNLY